MRDTIESIDLIREMIDQLDELAFAETADQVVQAFAAGKTAALIGMEGCVKSAKQRTRISVDRQLAHARQLALDDTYPGQAGCPISHSHARLSLVICVLGGRRSRHRRELHPASAP